MNWNTAQNLLLAVAGAFFIYNSLSFTVYATKKIEGKITPCDFWKGAFFFIIGVLLLLNALVSEIARRTVH